jgi:hypothetical protein
MKNAFRRYMWSELGQVIPPLVLRPIIIFLNVVYVCFVL